MRLHYILLFSCVLSVLALTTPAPAAPPTAKPIDVTSTPQVMDTVVRIDNNGTFMGTGVVLTPEGHVITTTRVSNDAVSQRFTVGAARTKAVLLVNDSNHGLAILKMETPLPRFATLDSGAGPAKNDAVRVIARLYKGSEPPMIELRSTGARVEDPHFRGDSATNMDLSDLLVIRLDGDGFDYGATGYAVFSPTSGWLQGIVIGRFEFGQNRLLAMSAPTIRKLFEDNKIALPK